MNDNELVWTKLSEKPFKGAYKTYLTRTYQLPNGTTADFDVTSLKSGKFVGCLALTADMQVIISKEFKPGPEEIVFNMPLGILETDETPEHGVRRELREETGYAPGELIALSPQGNVIGPYDSAKSYFYLGLNCELEGEQEPDEHELIDVITMPLKVYVNTVLRRGKACHSDCGWLALDYLLQHKMITLADISL